LRLGEVEAADVHRALRELSEAAFGDGSGVIRLQVSRRADGEPQLVGIPRGLGIDHPDWSAVTSHLRPAGEVLEGGHKLTNRVVLGLSAELATAAGADEALLFDADDRLVEGARSNIVVVDGDDTPAAPAPELGAVSGIALQVALECFPEISRRTIRRDELGRTREIIALNSVRGARPITRLDGIPVGDGKAGDWARKLAGALASG
jgi:branched-subunit amino acid aminotransferase/4-amino-4-deoxychorismate lyase